MENHKQRAQHQVYLDTAESYMVKTEGQRQDYIDQINDLKATIERLLGMIETLKQALDTVSANNKRNEELVVKLTAQIEQLQRLVKNLEE